MSRIRSIHPGLFTDEAFMSASAHARLLIIGIWTEAWDDGVFEWKPLTLKARIFPVDSVDVPALLSELEGLCFIRKFEAGGKAYGAVRNFRKYQRPKKPNKSEVLPNDLVSYVAIPEEVPNQFPTSGEKSPQMEDRGCRREDGEEEEEEVLDAPLASVAGKAKPVPKKGARLSDDWQPTESDHGTAVRLLGPHRAGTELAKFRDFWKAKPGKDGCKLDWDATYRNWVRTAADRLPTNLVSIPGANPDSDELQRRRARGVAW